MSKILKIFTQPACPACPPAKELGEKLKDKVKVEYFDVSQESGLVEAKKYNIMSTPTLVLVEDDKEVKTWIGTPEQEEVKKLLK